jgi:hypothetical protein
MAKHVVVLDGFAPSSVNQLLRVHWSKRKRIKRAAADAVASALERARVPRVAPPRAQVREARSLGIAREAIPVPGPSRPACRRRLRVRFTPALGRDKGTGRYLAGAGTKTPDPDNLNKTLRDALVDGGWLVDDRPDWLEGTEPVILPPAGPSPRTEIELEDLE